MDETVSHVEHFISNADVEVSLWTLVEVILIPLLGYLFWRLFHLAERVRKLELHVITDHPTKQDLNAFREEIKSELRDLKADFKKLYDYLYGPYIPKGRK